MRSVDMAIRILLADNHHLIRCGVKQLLTQEVDFTIAGEAENGSQILDLIKNGTEADVLLTDVSMPVMDGIQLSRTIRDNYPNLKIILLTVPEEEGFMQQAFQVGITGYVFKSAHPMELSYAVRQVASGRTYFCSGVSAYFIKQAAAQANNKKKTFTDVDFSERELDVLKLIAEGFTNEEAADKLFTSRRTVEGHRQAMINKTGCRNSLALVRFAVQHGFIN